MFVINVWIIWLILSTSIDLSSGVSYNQPWICPSGIWNDTATTFVGTSVVGSNPINIFLDNTNALYLFNPGDGLIQMWSTENDTPTRNLSTTFAKVSDIFVANDGDIYVANENNGQVIKWELKQTNSISVVNFSASCYSLFIDTNNTLYCSIDDQHQVRKISLINSNTSVSILAAGTGTSGSSSTTLNSPRGIFVSDGFNLYVADCGNDRIQLFRFGQLNATTIAGSAVSGTISLNCPTDVILDADDYLFISDTNNHRIVGSKSSGFQCLVGCYGRHGAGADEFNHPRGLAFDSFGNLFVVDKDNDRIQKFLSINNTCNITTVSTTALMTTVTTTTTTTISTTITTATILTTTTTTTVSTTTTTGSTTTTTVSTTTTTVSTITTTTTVSTATTTTTISTTTTTTTGSTTTTTTTVSTTTTTTTISTTTAIKTTVSSSSTSTMSTVTNQNCSAPNIILIPSTSTLLSPLQFRRNQDFFIDSYLQLRCDQSLSTISQWTIHNCTTVCSTVIEVEQMLVTAASELYIPAKTLPYGIYQLTLTVSMSIASTLSSSASAYVRITPSGITANLIQYGTSMITRGHDQDLFLDPGTFSVDPDQTIFNASNWHYNYYCRIYGRYQFPNRLGSYLTIDDPTIDPRNPSCLSDRSAWRYGSIKSSLTILARTLKSNQTYQFMVQMENRMNATVKATGYVLVQVEDSQPQLVIIACVISTLCAMNMEYQFVNPTTQVALFSVCTDDCPSVNDITWTVYHGVMNSSTKIVKWTPFRHMNRHRNSWFFGSNTANFTSTSDLFRWNSSIEYWRFEVIYSFATDSSSSALNFQINQPPQNGSCSITPHNGTTSTVFTISCPDWVDRDGIKDYSFYIWTTDRSSLQMIGFALFPETNLRLPTSDENTSFIHLIVHIRDTLDCITEYHLPSVTVELDTEGINDLIISLQVSTNAANSNPIVQTLASGNQNIIGQVITTLSQVFNRKNVENLDEAISNGVPAASISISALGSEKSSLTLVPLNNTALTEFNEELNIQAQIRDYLIPFTANLMVTTSNSIILQATSLAQLTQATNQLTRTTALLASQKCYQLASTLYSMATRISYDAVQQAVTVILQCTSNVMSGINGPLQERTTTLDLDFSRANAVPQDYDTDLESDWSNLNLFANGDDRSDETIEKNRNIYYQKQAAKQIADEVSKTISLITATLDIHLNIAQNQTTNTPSVVASMEKTSLRSLSNKRIQHAHIHMPSNIEVDAAMNTTVSLRFIMQPLAAADQLSSNSITNLSRSISLTVLHSNGDEISIQTNRTQPIELIIPRDPNLVMPSMTLQNVTSFNTTSHRQLFNLHYIDIDSPLPISIHFEIRPSNRHLGYLFIYRFDHTPILNTSFSQIDGWTLFCPARDLSAANVYIYYIDNEKTINHQSLIFGLRELNSTELNTLCSNTSITTPPIIHDRLNFTADYALRIYTSGCYYLDNNNHWQSDGLFVGPLTNHYQTQCFATHLTTLTSGFTVLPAPINWNYVFAHANFNQNKTVYLTVIIVLVLYLMLVIYARYKDKKDVEKLGVIPLPDNHPSDRYYYQIIVFTGHRQGAGTKSKVHFILSGDNDDTPVRTFASSNRSILQRGDIDAFILAVPKALGYLNYMRVWHDNTGSGTSASWFLKNIIVRDLQTMQKFHLVCQRWLAVEKDDGKIERVLFVAHELEKQQVSYALSKGAYHKISEDHLWFSIFSRPVANSFTRVQRCTCCFVLFFVSMFLSIMYYDLTTTSSSISPLNIGVQQIVVGIIVELFALIPSLLLVQIFRRLRPRQTRVSPLCQTLHRMNSLRIIVEEPQQKVDHQVKKKQSTLTLPWWWIIIAYGLCLMLMTLSIVLIIARGIEFGDVKTQQWLVSIVTSFFSSVLLTQPIKVLSLAIILACFIRNKNDDQEAGSYLETENFDLVEHEGQEDRSQTTSRASVPFKPLSEIELVAARNERLKLIHMWSILRKTAVYIGYLVVLLIITYSHRQQNAFLQVQHLRKYLLNTRDTDHDYAKITTVHQYWSWLEDSFVPNLRAQQWYNDQIPRYLNGFIDDKSNRLIGWAIMQQTRHRSNGCPKYTINKYCEEKRSFEPGWINETNQIHNSSIAQSFRYQIDDELDLNGYVYEFRGHLNDLRSNLSILHQLGWIDNQTHTVKIQLNLYNPNSQLFTVVTLFTDFSLSGGLQTRSRFEPFDFYSSFATTFQLICSVIYISFILYFMYVQVQSLFHWKSAYFKQFWSYIELGIIACSWTSVGLYVWRSREAQRVGRLFAQTNGYVYLNLQLSIYANDILTFVLGFCCFFGTIRFLRLLRFNTRLSLFTRTLRHASGELLSFTLMFSIIFMAFLSLFHLLFVSKISYCANLLETMQMLFEMILMKFNADELLEASAFLGPFCFSLFIFIIVFICMGVFLTILNESFRHARDEKCHDEEIFTFMWNRFRHWTGRS